MSTRKKPTARRPAKEKLKATNSKPKPSTKPGPPDGSRTAILEKTALAALTAKERTFVLAFVDTREKVAAYRFAYDCQTMSNATVRRKAVEVAAKPRVQAAILELESEVLARSVDDVAAQRRATLSKLFAIIQTDFSDVASWDGERLSVKDFATLTPTQRAAIQSMKIRPTRWGPSIEIRLHDRIAALTLAAKYLGLLQPDATDQQPITLSIRVVPPKSAGGS